MHRAARTLARALAAVLLLIFAVALPAAAPAVSAATTPPPQLKWLVKSNDLVDLAQQAATDGVTLPAFTWIGCGGPSDFDYCQAGQQPILTDYWKLHSVAQAGWGGTAVFDIEGWLFTPREQRMNPGKWICRAAHLQRLDPYLHVIITPFARPAALMISEDVEAARCGAYAVDLQTQFANGSPRLFGSFIRTAVSAIRRVNRKIVILAGLATNQPSVQTSAHLVADYHKALAAGVQGFWLNASNWQNRNHCATAQGGVGCPEVGVQFLTDIGLATRIGAASAPATSPSPATTTPSAAFTTPSPAATSPSSATTSPGTAATSPAAPSLSTAATSPAATSPSTATSNPRTATTNPSLAATSPRPATGNPAAGMPPTPPQNGDFLRLALDSPLSIVSALVLVVAAALAGWMAHRRADPR